jgi:hypothetical protein
MFHLCMFITHVQLNNTYTLNIRSKRRVNYSNCEFRIQCFNKLVIRMVYGVFKSSLNTLLIKYKTH